MAKIIEPENTFKTTKRLSERILLKNRREGITVSLQSLTKEMIFFRPEHSDLIKTKLAQRWENLSQEEKNKWNLLGANIFMDGETLFKQQEKKSMTQGFYGLATYGATRSYAIIATKYSTLYSETIYGVGKYRFK